MGLKSFEYKKLKRNQEANLVEDIARDVDDIHLATVISEVNLVRSKNGELIRVLPVIFALIKSSSTLLMKA